MSVIALPASDATAPRLLTPNPKRPHTVTPKQLAANRRNAARSTGPRTESGKSRSARDATTHGLSQPVPTCRPHASDEDVDPDFAMFLHELREELRPRSVLQQHLFPLIADLLWRLRRLPHAQQHLLTSADPGHDKSACQTLADAFASGTPSNPFLLLDRYERGLHNALLRLLKQYHSLEKDRLAAAANPRSQYDRSEPPCPPEPALHPDHPYLVKEREKRAAEDAARLAAAGTKRTHPTPAPATNAAAPLTPSLPRPIPLLQMCVPLLPTIRNKPIRLPSDPPPIRRHPLTSLHANQPLRFHRPHALPLHPLRRLLQARRRVRPGPLRRRRLPPPRRHGRPLRPQHLLRPPIIKSLRPTTQAFFDAHLMITDPLRYAPAFAKAGCNSLTFHVEVTPNPAHAAREIRKLGVRPGITLNPATPIESIYPALDHVDYVLIMSVVPGFSGQKFMPEVLPKCEQIKKRLHPHQRLQIDGGINPDTIVSARNAGCDWFVVASAIFDHRDRPAAIAHLRTLLS